MVLARELLPNYVCTKCSESMKKVRGCDAPPQQPVEFDGQIMKRCPMRPYFEDPDQFSQIFLLYRWYSKQYLPDGGTVLDQANRLVGCALIIDIALDDAERNKQRKREREARANKTKTGQKSKTTNRKPSGYRGKRGRRR